MSLYLPYFTSACLFGLASCTTLAAENVQPSPFFADLPVVLTASRIVQSPLDAPAPVTIIDREMIEASGFTEIHDLLRLVPGFVVSDWPNGSPVIANHGLGDAYDRRIKVLVDGRTINSPLHGDVNWTDLPLRVDDIERIEVVRGPNGAAYGANAFQGVVNILTRAPATEAGLSVIARAGRPEYRDTTLRYSSPSGSPVDWRLSASRRQSDVFRPYIDEPLKSIERDVFNFRADAHISPRDLLRLQLGATNGRDDRGTPESLVFPVHTDRVNEYFANIGWTHSFGLESEFSLDYHHSSRRQRSDWIATVGPFAIPIDRNADTRRDDLEFQLSHRLSPAWRFLWGGGVREDSARSEHYFTSRRTIRAQSWQTFGSVAWAPTSSLQVNAGGVFEDQEFGGQLFSPRLALNYRLSPKSALRLATGIAYRAPSLMEARGLESVQFNGRVVELVVQAGQAVEPEKVRYTELGYVGHIAALNLDVDARIFHERYSRYIDDQLCRHRGTTRRCTFAEPPNFTPLRDARGPTAFYLNSGVFIMEGAEASINWKKPGWGRIVLSQAFIDIREDGIVPDGRFVESAPNSLTSLLLIKELPWRIRLSVGYYHNHPMFWLNDGDRVPTRDRYDIRIARRFGPLASPNEIALVMQNGGGRFREFDEDKFRQEPQVYGSVMWTW